MHRLLPLLLCVVTVATTSDISAAPAFTVAGEVAAIEQQTSHIRHLAPKRPVTVRIVSDSRFTAALQTLLHTLTSDHDLDVSQTEEVMLGLLSPSQSLRKLTFSTSLSQVVGFYDQKSKLLWVRSSQNRVLGPERFNIAHEYTHALQDQYFHFSTLIPDESGQTYRNTDALAARHALTEGDAVQTQNLFITKTYSAADIKALLKLQSAPDTGPALPRSFQTQLLFPYVSGLGFVDALYKAGGFGAVNSAYRHPPESTYEVMHPRAYVAGWKPVSVALHAVAGFSDWHIEDDDVFGAFGYNLLLQQFLPAGAANQVTNGYRGDRYALMQQGTHSVMLFHTVWSSSAASTLAQNTLIRALRVRFPRAAVSGNAAKTLTYAGGAVYLARQGKRLSIAYAESATLARQLGTAPTT